MKLGGVTSTVRALAKVVSNVLFNLFLSCNHILNKVPKLHSFKLLNILLKDRVIPIFALNVL